MADHIFHLFYF